jgi:hypothetical protein
MHGTSHTVAEFFRQKVNSFLCIALISLLTFWVVLYYLSAQAEVIGKNWASSYIPMVSHK